eukprot:jgi/Psemu1/1219/gm1.1219_g
MVFKVDQQTERSKKTQLSSKVVPSVTPKVVLPIPDATKLDTGSSTPNKEQNGIQGGSAEGKKKGKPKSPLEVSLKLPAKKTQLSSKVAPSVTPKVVLPVPDATKLDTGSSKPNKGQNGVQDGSAEGKKKGKTESQSEVLKCIPGSDLRVVAPSTLVEYVPGSLFPPSGCTPQEHVPQTAATKEDVDYRESLNSVENNLQSALHGQLYASREFVKALSSDLVEQEEDLLKANLEVIFLSRTEAHNTKNNDLYLNGVFKYLEEKNDKVPIKTVMLDNEAESNTLLPHDDDGKTPEDKGNKSGEGNMDKNGNGKTEIDKDSKSKNNSDMKPAAKNKPKKELVTKENSIKTGNNDNKCNFQPAVGGKTSLVRNMKPAPTNQTQPLSKNGNNKKSKQNVEPLNSILDVRTVPKFPSIGGWGYEMRNVKVIFKDPDPEIVYPTYQIVLFHFNDGMGTFCWFPFFKVAPLREQEYQIYAISDLVQFYGEETGKHETGECGNKAKGQSGKVQHKNSGNSSSNISSVSTPLYNKRKKRLQEKDLNRFLYHFENGFDALLCAINGHLVLAILEGCKQTNACVSKEVFLDHEEGNRVAMDHIWVMGIILFYLLRGYPALKGTEDIKCYNNVGIGLETEEAVIEKERLANLYYSTDTGFYSTDKRFPVMGNLYTERIDEVQKEDPSPFLYHFETGYNCICNRNGYLVLRILD